MVYSESASTWPEDKYKSDSGRMGEAEEAPGGTSCSREPRYFAECRSPQAPRGFILELGRVFAWI